MSHRPTGRAVLGGALGLVALVATGVLGAQLLAGPTGTATAAGAAVSPAAPQPLVARAPVNAEAEPAALLTTPLLSVVTPPPPPPPRPLVTVAPSAAPSTERASRSGARSSSGSSGSGSSGSGSSAPAPRPPGSGGGSTASQVVSLVNAARADAGCGAVSTDGALTAAAQGHSADMAANDYFSHTSQDGRSFGDRIRAAGYGGGAIAENIAAGQSSASSVMASWMDSSGHRANILNCSYSRIGVGVAQGGSMGTYWTQTLGG